MIEPSLLQQRDLPVVALQEQPLEPARLQATVPVGCCMSFEAAKEIERAGFGLRSRNEGWSEHRLIGKLMGDPYLDYQAVVKEYCDGVFENAGATMIEFFDLLYAGRSDILSLEERQPIKHPKGMTTADIYINHYPAEKLARLEQLLQQAEKKADSDRARGWLRLTRDHFDFTTLVTKMVTAHRVFQKDGNPENWRELKRRVDLFDDFREKIISYEKTYTNRWFPGYDHFCNWMTGDAKHESTVYYKPWELRKPKVLKKGTRGMAIGYGGGFGYSFIKEPLTLDFSEVQD